MVTWYFKVEGRGVDDHGIDGEYGFFVHCLVAAFDEEEAIPWIKEALDEDKLVNVLFAGSFDSFTWDDANLEQQLKELAISAQSNPGQVFFSTFHSWRINAEI